MQFEAIHVCMSQFPDDLIEHFKSIGFEQWFLETDPQNYSDVRVIFNQGKHYIRKSYRGRGDKRILLSADDVNSLRLIRLEVVAFEYLKGCEDDNSVLTY